MKRQKYYVVWVGVKPGIYGSWTDCQLQTKGYEGARYKSFDTLEEAEEAFASPPDAHRRPTEPAPKLPPELAGEALAVDAACSGNPGMMEYRGVHLPSGRQVFHFGPAYGTNNIGEFLAIVHALALLKQRGRSMPVYSDSRNAIAWVRQKTCRTRLPRDARTEELFGLIARAENWLRTNACESPVRKWETDRWGEIPADFGRK